MTESSKNVLKQFFFNIHQCCIRENHSTELELLRFTYKSHQLKCCYRLRNMQLPTYFYSMPFYTNYQLHQHNTLSSRNVHIIRVIHEFAKKCIIQTVNDTPYLVGPNQQSSNTHFLCILQLCIATLYSRIL